MELCDPSSGRLRRPPSPARGEGARVTVYAPIIEREPLSPCGRGRTRSEAASRVRGRAILATLLTLLTLLLATHPALAQAKNPFSVGISEGGGSASGLVGWNLAQQAAFERLMAGGVKAARTDIGALWSLVGIAFAYGVFHAAGPGHGKAVLTSYLVANERALRRGLGIAALAALLQALVAIGLVGLLAAILHETAAQMRGFAELVETASYAGIALLGAWLVWRKGRALVALVRPAPVLMAAGTTSAFVCEPCEADDPAHVHGPACGHVHMPDPTTLGGARFDWREAAMTVFAAGLRPCSGAILVLVFSLAQGVLWIGIAATFAMAAGTAITTGALAALAVFAKDIALRLGGGGQRGAALGRLAEFAAALLVLCFGLLLLTGAVQLS